jgi:hypothetical protein
MKKHGDSSCDSLLLREILKKIVSIEAEIEKLKSKPEYHINIEKLELQQLDNLSFHLDALDIKELSGTLNIGTNFGSENPSCKPECKSGRKKKNADSGKDGGKHDG